MGNQINPVKINGYAKGNDQFLAAGLEMFTLTTGAGADMTNPYVLDAVIQTISTVCAPVLLGTPTATSLVFAVDRKGLPMLPATPADGKSVQEKLIALGATTVGKTFAIDANGNDMATAFADFTSGVSIAAGFAYGE